MAHGKVKIKISVPSERYKRHEHTQTNLLGLQIKALILSDKAPNAR
jgi:hypothetical protein